MFARERIFEYQNKPKRQLARILAEPDTAEMRTYERYESQKIN